MGSDSVTACTITGSSFTTCATPYSGPVAGTFVNPSGIAIYGSKAFVTNLNGASVTTCTVSGLTISGCSTPYTGSIGSLPRPNGIAIV
jgi:hypothetical protein